MEDRYNQRLGHVEKNTLYKTTIVTYIRSRIRAAQKKQYNKQITNKSRQQLISK